MRPIVEYGHSLIRRNAGKIDEYLYCQACERGFTSMDELDARRPYCTL